MSKLNNKELLEEAIKISTSHSEVLINMELRPVGGNFSSLKSYAKKFNLELPSFDFTTHLESIYVRKSNESIFVKDSTHTNRRSLKKRLIDSKILENKCSLCPIVDTWNNLPIVLQLDHINGIGNDNRIENLRLLCPNCHSQTETFCGKNKMANCECGNTMHFRAKKCKECKQKTSNKRNPIKAQNKIKTSLVKSFCQCGNLKSIKSTYCIQCSNGVRYDSKNKYPPLEELEAMVEQDGYSATGRILGVSDNAVRKRITKLRELQSHQSNNET